MRKNNQHYLEHLCIRKFKNPNNLTRLSFYKQNIFWVSSLENFILKYIAKFHDMYTFQKQQR